MTSMLIRHRRTGDFSYETGDFATEAVPPSVS